MQINIPAARVLALIACILLSSCAHPQNADNTIAGASITGIVCGDMRMDTYLPLLKNKNVGLVVNQTAQVNGVHLVDTLIARGISVKKIFGPEHGFRGAADAGENIKDSIDAKTGVAVVSLYGKKEKPDAKDLEGLDIIVFDIQDVGVRFYTFISTLHYLAEACAENHKQLMVLDRPNPNGWYVDGPVLDKKFKSFVGIDEIPVVHGLTIGEYAQMLNGEKWLANGVQCNLQVIACLNYSHKMRYTLPVKPSPNLPNALAVSLYPSICFFEGTNISLGRGTNLPFQQIGAPGVEGPDAFTPKSTAGAKSPPLMNQPCRGFNLTKKENRISGQHGEDAFTWQYVLKLYSLYPNKEDFFLKSLYFDKLCGTDAIRKMIQEGKGETEIKATYAQALAKYLSMRKKYLLYTDFE